MVYRDKETNLTYSATRKGRTCITIYLLLVLVGGCLLTAITLMGVPPLAPYINMNIPISMFLYAFPPSTIGSSIFYLRTLYLLGFNVDTDVSYDEEKEHELRIATSVFFYTRPVFIAISTYFLMLGTVIGVFSLFMGMGEVNESGWWVIMTISFFAGASGRDPLTRSLSIGSRLLDEFTVTAK